MFDLPQAMSMQAIRLSDPQDREHSDRTRSEHNEENAKNRGKAALS